jgi:phosphoglycolate phosphatase
MALPYAIVYLVGAKQSTALPAHLAFSHNSFMQVYLFDIDGTLISSGGAGKMAMEAALASEFGLAKVFEGVPYSGRTDRAIARDLFREHGIKDGPAAWGRFLAAYLRHLPACLDRCQGQILPGIDALLHHLGKRPETVMGLLTGNIRFGARIKLSHFGIFNHFAFGGFGDLHLDRDDVAREALVTMNAFLKGRSSPERVWVIGDTPLDVRCARVIGACAAAVATGLHSMEELAKAKPDVLLADLSDPTALL